MRSAETLSYMVGALMTCVLTSVPAAPDATCPVQERGTVVIKTQQYETMVTVRTAAGDGPADHVFHLWSRPAPPVDGGWRNVHIEYSGSALVLTFPETQKVIAFTVAGATAPPLRVPEGFSSTGYTMIGLSHEVGVGATRHFVRSRSAQPYELGDCGGAGFEQPGPWGRG
jgi:hypothetical protein